MEGEISNFVVVWTIAVASLCYCFTIGNLTSKASVRFFSLLPVIAFFFILPSNLHSVFLGGPSYFFLSWVATFKLLLFIFGTGPLSTNPPITLSHFISVACLPIKIHDGNPSSKKTTKFRKSPLNFVAKIVILSTFEPVYEHKRKINPKFVLLFYSIYLYIGLELLLAVVGAVISSLLGVEMEPQFDEPYLCTSLQDFWGRRWNLAVSNILRATVYDPVAAICSRWIGRTWSRLPAVISTFLVSGFMHELILYYIGRQRPTWELTWFFVVNGIGLTLEVGLKEIMRGKLNVSNVVGRVMALLFVLSTGVWLFLPSLVRCGVDVKARSEIAAFSGFMKGLF